MEFKRYLCLVIAMTMGVVLGAVPPSSFAKKVHRSLWEKIRPGQGQEAANDVPEWKKIEVKRTEVEWPQEDPQEFPVEVPKAIVIEEAPKPPATEAAEMSEVQEKRVLTDREKEFIRKKTTWEQQLAEMKIEREQVLKSLKTSSSTSFQESVVERAKSS